MRNKALLLTAAVGAIGMASAMAQVYSVNVVGFVKVDLVDGWNMVANPLEFSPTNFSINAVIPTAADGAMIMPWDTTIQDFSTIETYSVAISAWDPGLLQVKWGDSFMFNSPGASSVTFVGEVKQGALQKTLVPGYNMVGNIVPQQQNLTDMLLPAQAGDVAVIFDPVAQDVLDAGIFSFFDGAWHDYLGNIGQPTIPIGQGVFFMNGGAESLSWTRTFNVN